MSVPEVLVYNRRSLYVLRCVYEDLCNQFSPGLNCCCLVKIHNDCAMTCVDVSEDRDGKF
jgi:hypothetical protein